MYPEQFLKSLAVEFHRLATSGEEVNIKEWADKISAYLQYLKLQTQLEENLKQVKELEARFAIPKAEQMGLIDGIEPPSKKPRGRPKKEAEATE